MSRPLAPFATPTRRTVLGAAAVAIGVLVVGPGCSTPTDEGSTEPLRELGRSLDRGPDGDDLRARAAELGATIGSVADEGSVRGALDRLDRERRADFAARRTVVGQGWVLSRTEAAVLVAHARADV